MKKAKKRLREIISLKIRDLRLRKDLTGTTNLPRLMKKTNPKEIEYQDKVDFESEVHAYKEGIQADMEAYKAKDFVAPGWVKEALEQGDHMHQIKPENQVHVTPPNDQRSRQYEGPPARGPASSSS